MRVLVTGANGFVGRAVTARCAQDSSFVVRAATRRRADGLPLSAEHALVSDLDGATDWAAATREVNTVIHTAARVHVMSDAAADPLSEFRRVNVEGTLNLARQAAAAGARRFVFVSSVKVNGERSSPGRPLLASDIPAPVDAYGVSKHEAEVGLRQLAAQTGMEVTVIRPVLVYGPGVRGNFRTLMRWLRAGMPLPFGAVDNRRSLVGLPNLVDLIVTCARHRNAANQTFLVSDDDDLSTTALLRRTAAALGVRPRLLSIPRPALELVARLARRGEWAQRLCGSLQVDISATRERLDWTPPMTVDAVLKLTAKDFLSRDALHRRTPLGGEKSPTEQTCCGGGE